MKNITDNLLLQALYNDFCNEVIKSGDTPMSYEQFVSMPETGTIVRLVYTMGKVIERDIDTQTKLH